MHHPELHLIPKTMYQDDVENYFSLQQERVSEGKPTTLQFFESSASLETELLLSAEMTDTQGTCGSYDMTALPNLVSIPLIKPKQTAPDNLNYFSEKEGWELGYDDQMTPACVAEGTWDFDETFHDAADKQQLARHVKQTAGAPNDNFRKIICSEDDLRSTIFGSFSDKFLACLPLLGFLNFKKIV